MASGEPVIVRARGDEWAVVHSEVDGGRVYHEFERAHSVARNLAAELDEEIEIDHPRNVDLRRLEAT